MQRAPRNSTLFPYTTLFRSRDHPAELFLGSSGQKKPQRLERALGPLPPRAHDPEPREHVPRARPRAREQKVERSEEHTSELQSQFHLVCRLLIEKKNKLIQR